MFLLRSHKSQEIAQGLLSCRHQNSAQIVRSHKSQEASQIVQTVIVVPFFIIICLSMFSLTYSALSQLVLSCQIQHALTIFDANLLNLSQDKNQVIKDHLLSYPYIIKPDNLNVSNTKLISSSISKTKNLPFPSHDFKDLDQDETITNIYTRIDYLIPSLIELDFLDEYQVSKNVSLKVVQQSQVELD